VILVDSADSLAEGFDPERYSKVINCQVITESGAQLGRVLGFSFDVETGELTTLVIGALGVPLLGEGVLSTWELPVGEIVSSGSDRIIVYEGAEDKLKQLGTGLLEKLGIGGGGWEQEERQRFRAGAVPAENQLPAGLPTAMEQRRIEPATSSVLRPEQDYDYVELEERREREPLRQRRYVDEDEQSRFGGYRDGEDARRAAPQRESYPDERARRPSPLREEWPNDEPDRPYPPQRSTTEDAGYTRRRTPDPYRPEPDWSGEPRDGFSEPPSERWSGRHRREEPDDSLQQESPLSREGSDPRPRLQPDQKPPLQDGEGRRALEVYPRRSPSAQAGSERSNEPVDVDVEPLDDPW
jgi:sporulation protein YlmC with PRC-barrel domain